MIEIYGTLIDENAVKGVGPLMSKRPGDPTIAAMYNERSFYFEVYTVHSKFTIATDLLPFRGTHIESSKLAQSAITEAHKALRRCLIDGSFLELQIFAEHRDKTEQP